MNAGRKPIVTYETTPVVWIHVRGEQASEVEQARARLPICPRDGGLVERLHAFMAANDIYRAIGPGHSGGGEYAGGFFAPHAKMIEEFLKREGCEKTKQK